MDFKSLERDGLIYKSNAIFKIKQFMRKAESSLLISKHNLEVPLKEPEGIFWYQWSIIISYYSILYSAKALILSKGYEIKTHDAARCALMELCVSNEIEVEYFNIFDQAHRIFENEYVSYFSKALKESKDARYVSYKGYDEREANYIFNLAKKFVSKVISILN